MGFPHGSFKNKKRRVTITMPFAVRESPNDHEASESLEWLSDLSTLVEEGDDTPMAGERVRKRQKPFADGPTHSKPSVARDLHGRGGWFHDIGPTRNVVHEFASILT